MEQTQDTRSPSEVIIHTVILAATTLLSLTGNSLVCLAFYRNRRLRTVTNFYVLSLAVADIMVATFVFPFSTVASGFHRWPFNYNFCHFTGFVMLYWATVSLWTLALTSINRYFCVVKAQRYSVFFTKRKTFLSILFVWVYFAIFLPTFNSAAHVLFRWDPNILACSANYAEKVTERVAYISFACISFILLLVVLVGHGRVYCVVRQHNRSIVPSLQHAANNQRAIRAQEIKTCRVLFAAVFGFCISWIPFIASAVLHFGFGISIPTVAQSIRILFAFVSAWMNPKIYGFMNRAMRKEFQNILFCRKGD